MYDNMQEEHERIFEIGEAGTMERLKDKAYAHNVEVEMYREKIISMLNDVEEIRFLNQIHTILKRHIEKRGG